MGGAAIVGFAAAVFVLLERDPAPPARPRAEPAPTRPGTAAARPARTETPPASPVPPPEPPRGLQLDGRTGPDALVKAQAIVDDTLAELRRLDDSHQALAREVYMRGHSAAERVEDELAEDDEPGRAKLRADEDAMKAELARIYGGELTERP